MLRSEGESGTSAATPDAEVVLATDETYLYIPKNLLACAKVLRGDIILNFTRDKTLELQSDSVRFFSAPS